MNYEKMWCELNEWLESERIKLTWDIVYQKGDGQLNNVLLYKLNEFRNQMYRIEKNNSNIDTIYENGRSLRESEKDNDNNTNHKK